MGLAVTDRMRSLTTKIASSIAMLAVGGSLLACSEASEAAEDQDLTFISDGKADDFFSVAAREYAITGRTSVTLDASFANKTEAEKIAEVKKLIGYRQIALAWFLTAYLIDKEHEQANHDFGGFGGMAKAGAFEDFNVVPRADGLTYDFDFKQLAAGNNNMLERLPLRSVGGKQMFDLEVGTPSNTELAQLETNAEWYRRAPWSDWNPTTAPADKKTQMTFEIARDRDSTDA